MRSFLRAMLLGLALLAVTAALLFNFLLNRIADPKISDGLRSK